MANQPPPARPWFRLPSIARPPPLPTPTPAPEPPPPQPRPTVARPPFRVGQPQPRPTQPQEPTPQRPPPAAASPPAPATGVASVPTSPTAKASAPSSLPTSPAPTSVVLPVTTTSSVPSSPKTGVLAPTASLPSSPAPKPATSVPTSPAPKTVTTITDSTRVLSTAPSPRVKPAVQTPPESPRPKPTAPPPSPLTLPPPQVKSFAEPEPKIPLIAEQKTVLVQKIIDKPKPLQIGGDSQKDLTSSIAFLAKQEPPKSVETKGKGHHKKGSSDSEEAGMRVITIAGENKGAFMEVFHSPKKHVLEGNSQFLHKNGNPKNHGNEWKSHSSSSSGEEGNSKKDKSHKGRAMGTSPMSAFMNSNVQGVNNSIVFNSSCTHHDPGVHLALSRKAPGTGFHVKDHGKN